MATPVALADAGAAPGGATPSRHPQPPRRPASLSLGAERIARNTFTGVWHRFLRTGSRLAFRFPDRSALFAQEHDPFEATDPEIRVRRCRVLASPRFLEFRFRGKDGVREVVAFDAVHRRL